MATNYSITRFLGYLNKANGVSHGNRYLVELAFPDGISANTEELNLICNSASIPGLRIATKDRIDVRQMTKVPYTFQTEELTFGFLLDGNYNAKVAFDTWLDKIIEQKTHIVAYKKEIVANKWTIWQLNKNNEKVAGAHIYNVMPVSLLNIDFDEDNREPISMSITVVYDWHQTA